jgi:SAM-dependent methyltransferase
MRSPAEIRSANVRYHDAAADGYDFKWGIDFGPKGRRQVLMKLEKGLGRGARGPFAHALEVGAGTGYFSLNLLQAGVLRAATCVDVSPGMVAALQANARRLGLEVRAEVADAEALPFPDATFDLVLGHAVLHHLPDLDAAFAGFHRVLRPGGTLLFAGEPSRQGDRLAARPKALAARLAPAWRAALRVPPAPPPPSSANGAGHALEHLVDVHAFEPDDLRAAAARAGLADVRVTGEELLANWFGWTNRTLEATADPDRVPMLWRHYAYRGYLLLQEVDRRLLEGRLPAGWFYNLILSARRPAS